MINPVGNNNNPPIIPNIANEQVNAIQEIFDRLQNLENKNIELENKNIDQQKEIVKLKEEVYGVSDRLLFFIGAFFGSMHGARKEWLSSESSWQSITLEALKEGVLGGVAAVGTGRICVKAKTKVNSIIQGEAPNPNRRDFN